MILAQLFWEDVLQCWGVQFGKVLTILPEAVVRHWCCLRRPGSRSLLDFFPTCFVDKCAVMLKQEGTHPHTVAKHLGASNSPKCFSTPLLSHKRRGRAPLMSNNVPPDADTYRGTIVGQVQLSWQPRLILQIARQAKVCCHSREHVSTALELACVTPLHLMHLAIWGWSDSVSNTTVFFPCYQVWKIHITILRTFWLKKKHLSFLHQLVSTSLINWNADKINIFLKISIIQLGVLSG